MRNRVSQGVSPARLLLWGLVLWGAGCAPLPRVEETPPESPSEVAYRAGLEAAVEGRHARAIEHFHEAASLDPLRSDAHYRAGICHYELGNYELEAVEYRKALAISPLDARVWRALGLARASVDDLEGAQSAYGEAIRLEPRSEDYYNLAVVEEDLGRPERARALFERCLEAGEAKVRLRAEQRLRALGAADMGG